MRRLAIAGLTRIQDLGVGAITFPAAGTASDLALLLADHHGADLIVTVGYGGGLDDFFDRSRRETNPSTFLTRLKVGPKLVDANAVASLYRTRGSGVGIALLVLATLAAVIATLMAVSQLLADVPELAELDINPLLGTGDRILAVDARVRIER